MPRRLRVKLITIPWELEVPTLTLASLAAVTPERYFDTCIVDLLRERLVVDEPVDLVGISASTARIKAAYALARLFRERGAKVVIGGHHVTALPHEGLEHADAVVCGEGETSWQRICEQMLVNPDTVGGIYRDPAPDLTDLPLPRVDLMKVDRYQPYYYPVIASRGCPEACSFCFAKRMTVGYRTYPVAHVVEQLRRRPPWVKIVYFVDDNLAADEAYTRELFGALRRRRVPFAMQARHEFGAVPAQVALARDAGCVFLSSGFESINQDSLDRTGKRADVEAYQQVIDNVQRQGIVFSANWVFGFDWDPPSIFEQTWEFLRSSKIIHSTFTSEIPFPGTGAYRRYQREGRLITDDYDEFVGKDHVVHRPRQMTPEALQQGIRRLTLRYFSFENRRRLNRMAIEDQRFFPQFSGWPRVVAISSLNYFQVLQWHYRMTPSLRWLYDRLVMPSYKYRFLGDLLRRTNFFSRPFPPADPYPAPPVLDGTFVRRSGSMPPGRNQTLRPVELTATL